MQSRILQARQRLRTLRETRLFAATFIALNRSGRSRRDRDQACPSSIHASIAAGSLSCDRADYLRWTGATGNPGCSVVTPGRPWRQAASRAAARMMARADRLRNPVSPADKRHGFAHTASTPCLWREDRGLPIYTSRRSQHSIHCLWTALRFTYQTLDPRPLCRPVTVRSVHMPAPHEKDPHTVRMIDRHARSAATGSCRRPLPH